MRYASAALMILLMGSSAVCFGQRAAPAGASAGLISNLRAESIGTGFSAASITNGILQQSRAQAATNGISAAAVTNTSVSSGIGRSTIGPTRGIGPTAGGSGLSTKPFSSLNRGSTISPYLGLFEGIGSDTIDNYNALVRPRLEQQNFNRSVQRQQQQLNTRVQSISASPAFQPQGSEQIMPTGHRATFGFYGRFYPGLNRR